MTEEKKRQTPSVRISERGHLAIVERQARINKNRVKAGKRALTMGEIAECAIFNLSVEHGFNY